MQIKTITLLFVLSLFISTQCSNSQLKRTRNINFSSQENINMLGSASKYAVLAGSQTTNAGITTITGSLGVSPTNICSGTAVTMLQGVFDLGNTNSLNAQKDLTTAYNKLAGFPDAVDLTGKDLVGLTLAPGVYKYDTSCFLTAGTLTLDAKGDANARWVFQIGTTLITAVNSKVIMIGRGNPLNVYWQVGSSVTLFGGCEFVGNLVAYASITLNTGATLRGRALARVALVAMLSNTIDASLFKN